ncbi:hypothetical protein FAY30_13365 [Bacillus sp. S3]|uniref:metallophosphoesterase family protein n=1 Tax=Bacillus sp. S3 TaxID=486398 RepID=UPI001189FFAD|nr:metallophosphoesterase [Bacillus sp. S3]QCJ42819.1 hypothetical protein FAY30_13365 [Bacillus sp. S3]
MKKFIVSIILIIAVLGFPVYQLTNASTTPFFHLVNGSEATETVSVVEESDTQTEQTDNKPALQLAIMSDTHIDTHDPVVNQKFVTALQDLKKVAPDYDAISINGDMTNFGLAEEYQLFKSILKENKNPSADEFMVIGNHEWMEKRIIPETSVSDEQLKGRFIEEMNVSGLYYDKWINGYHFITIAGEKSEATMVGMYGDSERDSAYVTEEQIKWLEKTLPINAVDHKPIFVFFHQPITNTVYGSEWGARLQDQRILAILKKYPQVILFSGHSHYPLDHPKSIYTDGITMVNTSSVAYTYTPESGENYTLSQGYVVNVYRDKVEFKAREFSTGSWIKTVTIPITNPTQ